MGNRKIIWAVACLYATYGVLTLASGKLQTASLSLTNNVDGRWVVGGTFLLVAFMAIGGMAVRNHKHHAFLSTLLLLPQTLVIILSALVCISLAFSGHYADGVQRSFSFIFADQLPTIILAILHTQAVLNPVTRDELN